MQAVNHGERERSCRGKHIEGRANRISRTTRASACNIVRRSWRPQTQTKPSGRMHSTHTFPMTITWYTTTGEFNIEHAGSTRTLFTENTNYKRHTTTTTISSVG